jgi:23S rRNA pseudouridine1911/1915/1917 synthase
VFHVPPGAAGTRLDRFLADQPLLGSRTRVERLLARGAVEVDGRPRPKSHRLEGGEVVRVTSAAEPVRRGETGPWASPPAVRIAFEDEHLLVVDKPAGLLVHAGAGREAPTLVDLLQGHGIAGGDQPGRPGVVHRLDRDTSGLLVLARSPDAYRPLVQLVRGRELLREYAALVRGRPRSWAGRIEARIGRDRRDPTRQSLDTSRPRDAVTHFEVRELLPEHALLTVRLETGRMHQIRVHLEAIGLPVSGDPVYGVAGDLGLERQFLHAERLGFVHPFTGESIDLRSPLPPDLARALAAARG